MQIFVNRAKEIGIDALAITDAKPFIKEKAVLEQVLQAGLYPQFVETDLALRTDPKRLLPSVQSIISVAIAYKSVDPHISQGKGLLSRYAWGHDYHSLLYPRLETLAQWMVKEFGVKEYVVAVDTKPPIERAIALRSGLGWLGQNCAIFVPPYGSWVFLGELLVDIPLPFTTQQPLKPNCSEKCGRCVRACPTNALFAPYQINPHSCISYLTQMKGIIPREMRAKIGAKLWGCDTCQQVCPTNQKALPSQHQEFYPLDGTAIPLIPLLSISKKEFHQRFGHTALAWRGHGILQRNAAIILGNLRYTEAIPALGDALQDPKPFLRASVAWALGEMHTASARNLLHNAQHKETNAIVLEEIELALSH